MVPKLLLTLILSASYMFCDGSEAVSSLKVYCRSSRYPISIECSWVQFPVPDTTTLTKFIARYRVGYNDSVETKTCLQPRQISRSCTMYDFALLSSEPHVLNITAINPEGITTTLFPFVPEDIIKPDPPLIFRVSTVSENELEVQWSSPGSWPDPDKYRLKYQVRYKRCKADHFLEAGPTEDTTLRIKVVIRKGKYCIEVNCQHHLGYGQPSEWSPTTVFPIMPFK